MGHKSQGREIEKLNNLITEETSSSLGILIVAFMSEQTFFPCLRLLVSQGVGVSYLETEERLLLGSWGDDCIWPPMQVTSHLLLCKNGAVGFVLHEITF